MPSLVEDGLLGSLFSLRGRTALVTGASRGIGSAIAEGLAGAGATVFAISRTAGSSSTLHYRPCDILDEDRFALTAKEAAGKTGRLDILVNAAGITLPGDDLADFDTMIRVNVRAAYACARIVAPLMAGGPGSIVNVTSLGAHRGFPRNPGYVASKGALSQLTRALAADLGPKGIRVNNLVPGYITTAMTAQSYADPVERERRSKHTMLGRWGRPEDLIGAAIFLASDASAYVTGQDIVVDGGWLAKGLV